MATKFWDILFRIDQTAKKIQNGLFSIPTKQGNIGTGTNHLTA